MAGTTACAGRQEEGTGESGEPLVAVVRLGDAFEQQVVVKLYDTLRIQGSVPYCTAQVLHKLG